MSGSSGSDRKRQRQEINVFHSVAKAITSSLNLNSILQTIMEQVAEIFQPAIWSLLMWDAASQEIYPAISVGDSAEAAKRRIRLGEGVAGWVVQFGEPVIVPDVSQDPRFSSEGGAFAGLDCRSILCFPLKSRERVLGAIQLVNFSIEDFSESEIFLLQALCDYAAIAIDNAQAVQRIQELTITDDCTGLYNARHLYKTLENEIYRSARFDYQFAVVFIDLDFFKQVNDTYGHIIGSKLLAEVGHAIKSRLRLVDLAFRYGGDEFVVVLPQTSKDGGIVVATRLLEMFRHTEFLSSERLALPVRASLGVSSYPEDGQNGSDIIRRADESMYAVKRASRNGVFAARRGLLQSGEPKDAPRSSERR
jgi:diguanylate cyclase (GGDEF)-like protein